MEGKSAERIGLATVFPVSGYGMAYPFQMSPYLVFPAGFKFKLKLGVLFSFD